eukprot:COSAG02_NODE_247_length_27137_cov_61.275057_19_plen_168_part_00
MGVAQQTYKTTVPLAWSHATHSRQSDITTTSHTKRAIRCRYQAKGCQFKCQTCKRRPIASARQHLRKCGHVPRYALPTNLTVVPIVSRAADIARAYVVREAARNQRCAARGAVRVRIHPVQSDSLGDNGVDCRSHHLGCRFGAMIPYIRPTPASKQQPHGTASRRRH